MREVATSGADGWKSRSKGISSWTVSIAAAGGEREREASRRRRGATWKTTTKTPLINVPSPQVVSIYSRDGPVSPPRRERGRFANKYESRVLCVNILIAIKLVRSGSM
jgi:hypothetical protein